MKNDLNERVSRQEAAMNQLVMERDAIKNELQGEVVGLKKAVDDSNGENLRLQQKLEVLQSEMEKDIEEGNEVIRSMESPAGNASSSTLTALVVHSSSKKRKMGNPVDTTTPVAANPLMDGDGITSPKIIGE